MKKILYKIDVEVNSKTKKETKNYNFNVDVFSLAAIHMASSSISTDVFFEGTICKVNS